MRFLANENMPAIIVKELRLLGHDVAWVLEDGRGSPDEAVLQRGQAEERVLLTFDKDFGQLAFHAGLPATSGIVLYRIRSESPELLASRALAAIADRSDWIGHFSVVENDRLRMVPVRTAE